MKSVGSYLHHVCMRGIHFEMKVLALKARLDGVLEGVGRKGLSATEAVALVTREHAALRGCLGIVEQVGKAAVKAAPLVKYWKTFAGYLVQVFVPGFSAVNVKQTNKTSRKTCTQEPSTTTRYSMMPRFAAKIMRR